MESKRACFSIKYNFLDFFFSKNICCHSYKFTGSIGQKAKTTIWRLNYCTC